MNNYNLELLSLLGITAGISGIFIFGWLLMLTLTTAKAIYQKRNIREAIQPLLDEF